MHYRKPCFKSSIASRIFGSFASYAFPFMLQSWINKAYTFLMNVDLKEFKSASSYPTLNALFTRELLHPRPIDNDPYAIIAPCDGRISACGQIEEEKVLQIKGWEYPFRALLGDYINKAQKERLVGGLYANVYLSPKDYHRYHAPCDMQVLKAVHIPGKLYPVNLKWLQKVKGLFVENERVVLECLGHENTLFYMVFVGALNVGKMRFTFDASIQTNAKEAKESFYMYKDVFLKKGDCLGNFEMGSTIVMFFEKKRCILSVSEGEPLYYSNALGRFYGIPNQTL